MTGSGFFKLNAKDFVRGAVSAVIAAIVGVALGLFGADFNVFTADWGAIGQTVVNAAFYGFVGYLGKNLLTTEEGKFLGVAKL